MHWMNVNGGHRGKMKSVTGMIRYPMLTSTLVAALTLLGGVVTPVSAQTSPALILIPSVGERCTSSSLTVNGGRQGAPFANAEGTVIVTNSSNSTCYLSGSPSVALLRSDGKSLQVRFAGLTHRAHLPLRLPMGDSAGITTYWSNWCGKNPGPLDVRLTLKDDGVTVTGPFNGPPAYNYVPLCDNKKRPSSIQIVTGFHIDG